MQTPPRSTADRRTPETTGFIAAGYATAGFGALAATAAAAWGQLWTAAGMALMAAAALALTLRLRSLLRRNESLAQEARGALERNERERRERSDALNRMAQSFRTPLAAMMGAAERLATVAPGPARDASALMLSGCRQLRGALRDLSQLELDSADVETRAAPFDARGMVRAVEQMYNAGADARVKGTVDERVPPRMVGDEGRIMQLLGIFLDAVLAGDPRAAARIDVSMADFDAGAPTVRFAVTRHPPSARRQPRAPGAGENIGQGVIPPALAAARGLVRALGGTLGMAEDGSQPESVWAVLPLEPSAVQAADGPVPLAEEHRRLRILVAEDTPSSQEVLRLVLQDMGHTVTLTANGSDALTVFLKERFDVVMLDLQMPLLDGFRTATWMRTTDAGKNVPIIAVTAIAPAQGEKRARASGVDAYLTKPVRLDALRQMLSRIAEGSPREALQAGPQDAPGQPQSQSTDPEKMHIDTEIDSQALQELIDMLGADDFQLAYAQFSKDVAATGEALDAAVRDADIERIRRTAHKLKGMLMQFGAAGAGRVALATEKSEPGETLAQAALLARSVSESVPRLEQAVKSALAAGGATPA